MIIKLPKRNFKIKVGVFVYRVIWINKDDVDMVGTGGTHSATTLTIKLKRFLDQDLVTHCFLHEVFHALYFQNNWDGVFAKGFTIADEGMEEPVNELIVAGMANAWHRFMEDNPELFVQKSKRFGYGRKLAQDID